MNWAPYREIPTTPAGSRNDTGLGERWECRRAPQQGDTIKYAGVVKLGSDGSAAGGGESDLSEWPRSADEEAAVSATKMPGTATGRHNQICGRGEIGRHVGFRFQWISVQVQVLSPVPKIGDPRQRVADFTYSLFTIHSSLKTPPIFGK